MTEIARRIATGRTSAQAVVQAALDRIDATHAQLNAFVQVFHEAALAQARAIDRAIAAGQTPGPLAGVPIAVKDNICMGQSPYPNRTTCASRMLEHYRSPFSATAVQRLLDAGAVVVGKTNLDEFAMGASGEHSCFGPSANPWDTTRTPGGSSSGSAAAVATGCVPLALGSDTGGSVRQPAAMCGIVGLKPTYGRVSRLGLVAFASSLDQIGTLTASVQDAALALSIIAGHDPQDATSAPVPYEPDPDAWQRGAAGRVVACLDPDHPAADGLHPGVADALNRAQHALASAGARLEPAHLQHLHAAVAAYYVIAPAEASSNLARYDGVRYGRRASLAPDEGLEALYTRSRSEGLGPEVQRRILLGTHALSSGYRDQYYGRAQRARRLIRQDYLNLFERGVHAVLMPTTAAPAFRLGEKLDDPWAMYQQDAFTVGANLAGLPAISVPAGLVEHQGSRLPVGVQLVGRPFDEAGLLAIAADLHARLGPLPPCPLDADPHDRTGQRSTGPARP